MVCAISTRPAEQAAPRPTIPSWEEGHGRRRPALTVSSRHAVFLLALAVDLLAGELPAAVHPVVGMGRLIALAEQRSPRQPAAQLLYGATLALALPLCATLVARLVLRALARRPGFALALEGLVFSTTFAVRELAAAAHRVEVALLAGDLPAARAKLPALVSRDPTDLSEGEAAAAAIESLAENFSDSIVAPWLYFWCFGTVGAFAYRAVNTLDSMIGYHGRYEWLGKAAARLDDLAGWLPARLAAILLVFAGPGSRRSWAIARRDHHRTASPNAGWPMSAMAGALDRRLEKRGHYALNPTAPPPAAGDIARARRRYWRAVALAAALLALALSLSPFPAGTDSAGGPRDVPGTW